MIVPKSGNNIGITEIHENTSQELISITGDKLKLILLQNLSLIESNKAWQMPLSLLLTIILVFCSADFKDAFGLQKNVWSAIFIISSIICAIWLIVCLFKLKKSITVDGVIDLIKNKNNH
ncbi:hypothetical protein GALL_283270 [mine drainage metagenome]|uniref:Uncharacterized protein n=1 Tax=mine drainage metagenome TaxID=410659 RepID=A0A1J5RJL7_9ZZZZ